jgi:hypothetical protein
MKVFFSLIIAALLLSACSQNQATNPSNQSPTPNNNEKKNTPLISPETKIMAPKDDQSKISKPASDGKTVPGLYDHLKAKGWKFSEAKPSVIRMFDAEETYGFRDERNIGFVAMRFEDVDKAKAQFPRIDQTYRNRSGRAVTSQNFVIAVFGVQVGINKGQILKLEDSSYQKLQADLNEFLAAS